MQGLDKFVADLEDAESRVKEALEMMEDQKRIAQAKSKMMEKDAQKVASLQKELAEVKTFYEEKFKNFMDGAKKSAVVSILQAKIQLMKPVIDGDFDPDQILKEHGEWQRILASLTGESSVEIVEQTDEGKTSEVPEVEEEKEGVADGDDGIHDQA